MTQEEKQLLLVDLCGRLPYGGNLYANIIWEDGIERQTTFINTGVISDLICDEIKEIKPYLRPMSSMMQGEWEEMTALIYPYGRVNRNPDNKNELLLWLSAEGNEMPIILMNNVFSWLNAHYFDYRGLIPMGLALEAKERMYRL